MKKTYRNPEIRILQLQQRYMLLNISVKSMNNNAGLNLNTHGSSGEAHSRSDDMDDWEDDEIEE